MRSPLVYIGALAGASLGLAALFWSGGQSLAHPKKAHKHGISHYQGWKNRPKEAFKQPQKTFAQILKLLKTRHYDKSITDAQLYKSAIQGMLHFLRPKEKRWNRLFSPKEYAELKIHLRSSIVGIGIQMRFDSSSGMAHVLGVIPGSPAQAAGLLKGDKILKVDGVFYKGKDIRDVVYAIRGKIGTKVRLSVLRNAAIVEKILTRGKVRWSAVKYWKLPQNIGLLRLSYFTQKAPQQLETLLKKLAKQPPKAWIVDLRGNSGGLLKSALACADLLLPKGKVITQLKYREGKPKPFLSKKKPLLKPAPMVVLIDRHTASGAELVAAALRDSAKARLLGQPTLGKWNVQTLAKLPNGYVVKYTIGQFATASGQTYHSKGLPPHIPMSPNKGLSRHSIIKDIQKRLARDASLRIAHTLLLGK